MPAVGIRGNMIHVQMRSEGSESIYICDFNPSLPNAFVNEY